jgi:hypothetical protein
MYAITALPRGQEKNRWDIFTLLAAGARPGGKPGGDRRDSRRETLHLPRLN